MMKPVSFIIALGLCACNSTIRHQNKDRQIVPPAPQTSQVATQDEPFVTFFSRFNTDSLFQKSRTRFPLKGTFLLDPTDDESDSTFYVQKHESFFVQLTAPKSNIVDGITRIKTSGNDSQKTVTLTMEDSGVYIEYFFRKINGKWLWISYHDMST